MTKQVNKTRRLENWQISFCKQADRESGDPWYCLGANFDLVCIKTAGWRENKTSEKRAKIVRLTEDALLWRSYINPQEKWSFVMKWPLETFVSFTLWARKIIHRSTTRFISGQRKCCLQKLNEIILYPHPGRQTHSHAHTFVWWEALRVMCALFSDESMTVLAELPVFVEDTGVHMQFHIIFGQLSAYEKSEKKAQITEKPRHNQLNRVMPSILSIKCVHRCIALRCGLCRCRVWKGNGKKKKATSLNMLYQSSWCVYKISIMSPTLLQECNDRPGDLLRTWCYITLNAT